MHRLKNFTYAYGGGEEEEQEQDKIKSIHRSSMALRSSSAHVEKEKPNKTEMRFTTFKSALSHRSSIV